MPDIVATAIAQQNVRDNAGIIQQVGPLWESEFAQGITTMDISYVNAGDFLMIEIQNNPSTNTLTGITSKNGKLGVGGQETLKVTDTTIGYAMVVWSAEILEPGDDTLIFTWATTPAATDFMFYAALEFTANYGPETTWYADGTSVATDNTASTNIVYPSKTPAEPDYPEFYFGYAVGGDAIVPPNTPTPGVYYEQDFNTAGMFVWYPNAPQSAISPRATQVSSQRYMVCGLVKFAAQGPTLNDTIAEVDFPIVPTGVQRIIYQVITEVLTDSAIPDGAQATTYLNGRILNVQTLPAAIQGPPFYTVRPGDNFNITFTGVPLGAQCVAKFLYQEYANTGPVNIAGVV